ncbi:hypothetical protein RSAG8_05691, partial [Rhizoctonia solani AG-8 WAC10335]
MPRRVRLSTFDAIYPACGDLFPTTWIVCPTAMVECAVAVSNQTLVRTPRETDGC